jgi:EAL domain-containing protein (putative c-di-GMP-specific phosphodiesterase class I)/GGDEF domain-containing protein
MTTRIPEPKADSSAPGDYVILGELAELIGQSERAGRMAAIIVLEIEPDSALYRLSIENGQKLKREVGLRLASKLRATDRVHALDGYGWLLLLPDIVSTAVPQLAMLKVNQAICEDPIPLDGLHLRLRVKGGGAIAPAHGSDALHVIQSARIALVAARQQGKDFLIFEPAFDETTPQQAELEAELRVALNRAHGLELYLQPKVEIASGLCDSAEALLRWTRENGERVPPPVVIAAVERMGLRRQFNHWLLQRYARTAHSLATRGLKIQISVNLSASDFLDPETPDLVSQALATWRIPSDALRLECTETGIIEDGEANNQAIKRLHELGVTLAIDDFGTGFAGMSRLQKMAVQEVKIDRSFIVELGRSVRDREIVSSIIELSHRLGISVTAEGVEDAETAERLATMGCHHIQGFLYSPALPPDKFADWVLAHNSKP